MVENILCPELFVTDNKGENLVSSNLIWNSTNSTAQNVRMLEQGRFNLNGGDVLATATYDIFASIDEIKTPVLPFPDDVSGMPPAAVPACLCRHLIFVVATEESLARIIAFRSNQKLASLAWHNVRTLLVNNSAFGRTKWPAYTSLPNMAWILVGNRNPA